MACATAVTFFTVFAVQEICVGNLHPLSGGSCNCFNCYNRFGTYRNDLELPQVVSDVE